MRERAVDIALLVGLVVVCVLIVFALFSPTSFNFFGSNPSQTAAVPEPSETVETGAEAAETAPPVIASEGADGTVDVSGDTSEEMAQASDTAASETAANSDTDEATADATTEAEDASADGEATTESETAAASESAPPGSVQLERVGFSFVTGNAHACGVVLEAWQHVAVSRDLLERYPCGSEVTITLDEPIDGRTTVNATVGDTMNPDTIDTVNIYVGTDEPAEAYGVQTGRLSVP